MLYPRLDWRRTAPTAWIETALRGAAIMPLATVVAGDAPFPVEAAAPFVRLVHLRGPRLQPQCCVGSTARWNFEHHAQGSPLEFEFLVHENITF